MDELAIDKTSNSANSCRVMVTMMAIGLRQGLIATHTTNGMLDDNAAFGEGGVISHILSRTCLAARLAA